MADLPPTDPSSPPTPPRPTASPNDYLGAILGVVLIAYGIYLIVQSGGTSYLGPLLILLGITFQPWVGGLVSMAGGAGLLVWAVWWTFFKASGPMDYLYSIVAVIVGLGAIMERWGRFKRRP